PATQSLSQRGEAKGLVVQNKRLVRGLEAPSRPNSDTQGSRFGTALHAPLPSFSRARDSCTKPRCEPWSFADQAILIEVVNNKERPGIFERHLHIARHRGGSQSELRIGKFETAAWARKRDVEGFAGELVDLGTRLALQDARYLDPCRPSFQVGLDINRQEQGLAKLRTGGCEDGEDIAQGLAGLT